MTCATGKREFPSKRAANRGLRSLKNPQGTMHAYKCEQCSCWHLGHNELTGRVWSEQPPIVPGYKRPRDVVSSFIIVGTHQVVFGNVCLSCAAAPHAADDTKQTLLDLNLPDAFLDEVWQAGDRQIADTLLAATPQQIEQIKAAWDAMHR